ncbi:MAG: hypothetical protein GSR80_001345 [Desulfurococcales archaeon]|nr:hypothetical protein [Desulfurococcales archaeon]
MSGGIEERVESMIERYRAWPRHFRLAWERGLEASPGVEPRAVVICGMGSSAAAGEHAAAILEEVGLRAPLTIVRSFEPPAWLSSRDLVVSVSYSGNTWETLECTRRASRAGASVAAVTAGGELLAIAGERGWPTVRVEPGEYGRTSMAYLLGGILGLLSKPSGAGGRLEELAGHVTAAFESTEPEEARGIAEALAWADCAFIAACGRLSPAARRWRTELGENTKMPARDDVYPESGHNDIVALQAKPGFRGLLLVLRDPVDPVCNVMLDASVSMHRSAGYRVEEVMLQGPSTAFKLARSAILAGYASTIAAGLRGVDPHETPNLTRYKEGVKARLG